MNSLHRPRLIVLLKHDLTKSYWRAVVREYGQQAPRATQNDYLGTVGIGLLVLHVHLVRIHLHLRTKLATNTITLAVDRSRHDDTSEPRRIAMFIRFLSLVEWELLDHALDAHLLRKSDAFLAIFGGSGGPPANGEALRNERSCPSSR